jgi:hypothetical protein
MVDITNITDEEKGSMDAQRFNQPIPGSSMTNDPENPAPYSRAPEITDTNEALESIVDELMAEGNLDGLIDSLMQGAPADGLARVVVEQGFAAGKWNPDLAILLAEPVTYLILSIGELVQANPTLSDDGDDEADSAILDELNGLTKPKEITPEIEAQIKENVDGTK